ncbi:MAG: FG-GAP repeat domain-containing protein [Ardenticatenaceae bacterium]
MNKHNFFSLKNNSLGHQVLIGLLLVLFGLSAWFWVQGASGFGEVSDLPDLGNCASNVKVPFCATPVATFELNGADDVYAADIDRDGDLDLVGAGFGAGHIAWWQNTGDGFSQQPRVINKDNPIRGPDAIVGADLDRDGDLDIVASAFTGDQISWFENDNNGSSWTPHVVVTGTENIDGPKSVVTADINGDGHLDIVAAAIGDDLIAWWENDGTPTDIDINSDWTKHEVSGFFDGAISVIAADIDRDGDLDIVGAASGAGDIAWWENQNGDGSSWQGPHTVDGQFANVTSVIATDVDQDGNLDIVGAASGEISWWQNRNGQGTDWNKQRVDNSTGGTDVIASDVDQDGDVDLLAASGDQVALWENRLADGANWEKQSVDDAFDGAQAVYSADIDQDGDLDLLGAAYDADQIAWWENQSMHRSAVYAREPVVRLTPNANQVSRIYSAHMDKDGAQDILAAALDPDQIVWWRNQSGDGDSWSVSQIENVDGVRDLYPADLDRDGNLDVVAAAGNKISWWSNSNENGTWGEQAIESNFNDAAAVIAADLNGDGKLDILGAAANEGISWWQNMLADGRTWSSKKRVDSTFHGATDLYVADLDRDGDQDILAASETNNQIAWWKNEDGAGTFLQKRALSGTFNGASAVYAADIDHDGDIDVLGAAKEDDQIAWWENDGDGGGWMKHLVGEGFNGAHDVYAADMDADGDLDIVAAAHVANGNPAGEIRWWENPDNGSSWTPHSIDQNFDGASSVIATDMDRDGDLDLLAGGGHQIAWWKNGIPPNVYLPIMRLDPTPTPTATPTFTPTPTIRPTDTPIPTATFTPTPACLTQETEPNNTSFEAGKRDPLCRDRSIEGKFSEENDEYDIYLIEPETAGTIVIDLTNIQDNVNYKMCLHRSSPELLCSSSHESSSEKIEYGTISPGSYFIFVRAVGNERSSQSYRLIWHLK